MSVQLSIFDLPTSSDTHNVTSLLVSASGPTHCAEQDGPTTVLSGPAPAHANRQHGHDGGCRSSNDCGQHIRSTELPGSQQTVLRPGPTNGLWADADWLHCRDGKWRPVEPGTFPLAHGAAARVGRLRGYGNAIVAPAAQAFIEAYLETELVAANDDSPFAKAA